MAFPVTLCVMLAKSKTSMKIIGHTHDVDGAERAFLGTDATANAETFRYEGNLGLGRHLYAEFPCSNNLEPQAVNQRS
jgi:hypothetical protein